MLRGVAQGPPKRLVDLLGGVVYYGPLLEQSCLIPKVLEAAGVPPFLLGWSQLAAHPRPWNSYYGLLLRCYLQKYQNSTALRAII